MSKDRRLSTFLYKDGSYNQIRNIDIVGAPNDCDWSRWAMVHSSDTSEGIKLFRVYCFKQGANDTLYQFGYNYNSGRYEFGYDSTQVLKIKGVPLTANTFTFSMLHDGSNYRLYFLDVNNHELLYQFVFNGSDYVVEEGNPKMILSGMPADMDSSRMAMLYAKGNDAPGYHLYGFEQGKKRRLVQAYYDLGTNTYKRINDIQININPSISDISSFSMVNDGDYWCYFLNWID